MEQILTKLGADMNVVDEEKDDLSKDQLGAMSALLRLRAGNDAKSDNRVNTLPQSVIPVVKKRDIRLVARNALRKASETELPTVDRSALQGKKLPERLKRLRQRKGTMAVIA